MRVCVFWYISVSPLTCIYFRMQCNIYVACAFIHLINSEKPTHGIVYVVCVTVEMVLYMIKTQYNTQAHSSHCAPPNMCLGPSQRKASELKLPASNRRNVVFVYVLVSTCARAKKDGTRFASTYLFCVRTTSRGQQLSVCWLHAGYENVHSKPRG